VLQAVRQAAHGTEQKHPSALSPWARSRKSRVFCKSHTICFWLRSVRIWGLSFIIVAWSVATLGASAAHAQVGPRALPALFGTPRLSPPEQLSFALAAAAGYGLREPLTSEDALHHTGLAGLGAALATPWGLGAELRLDGRLEKHTAHGDRGTGMVGELRGYLRYAHALGARTRLGAELGVWVPGGPAPSLRFSATTVDALLALDAQLGKAFSLLVASGFRFDQSAAAVSHPEELSTGDYVTLGLSDSHAVLVRAGVARELRRGQLFLEWTWDALLGSQAPKLGESPMFVALGGRAALTEDARLALTVSARALVSARPTVDQDGPLVPFPPRAELWCGLRFETGKRAPAAKAEPVAEASAEPAPAAVAPAPVPPPPVTPQTGTLRARVLDTKQAPIAGASVSLDGLEAAQATDAAGEVSFDAVSFGTHTLRVSAEGFQPLEQSTAQQGASALHTLKLTPVAASGQLRLLVRDHRSGEALEAEVHVQPETESGAEPVSREVGKDGRLRLDLPPGRYLVVVKLKGWRKQRKTLEIEDRSVTILDVALHARSKKKR
jgi:hypothetical protein